MAKSYKPSMNIFKATADFEHWLAGQLPIIRQDLALKHQHKAEAEFPFFRATFYRWLQLWPELLRSFGEGPGRIGCRRSAHRELRDVAG